MKKSDLGKICGITRQMVYHHLNNGLSEEEILKRYFKTNEVIAFIEECKLKANDNETVYIQGVREGFKQCKETVSKELNKMTKDLKTIKEIVKKSVLDYQKSNNIEFTFNDVNEIYEIVKDY